MSEQDRDQFRSAVKGIKSAIVFEEWDPAMAPLTRLAMFDMLPVVDELGFWDRRKLASAAGLMHDQGRLSDISFRRIQFAFAVVEQREIRDVQLPEEQVNDGRVFLGCTPLNDDEVRRLIQQTLDEANAAIRAGESGTEWATLAGDQYSCCGATRVAWVHILVKKRRAAPRASLNANLAAAAHYMLARFHVCAALASTWQMDRVIEGYDNKKRNAIAHGDRDLNSMALTPGNPPFPPDFVITKWAKQGSVDGNSDRIRCNRNADPPLLVPEVNGSDA
jgi:hypothetical protein